ncbi:MAG: sporulation transcriptional regulator SpoIIID [Clostridia bacterium]|nr:sporulation transcriptional regulator SpoIIID [Clostridia bacterium]
MKVEEPELYLQVKEILEKNKSERHIRGGMATKAKYKKYPKS